MPATTKGTRGNVGKSRNELEKKQLFTKPKGHLGSNELLSSMNLLDKIEQLHYRAYKKNVITLQTVLNYSPRLAEYMKSYEKK